LASSPSFSAGAIDVRPRPPVAKRLNRNALTVAAVIAGVTVLVAVVLVQPSKTPAAAGSSSSGAAVTVPIPARPTFLDQPPKTPPASQLADSVRGGVPPGLARVRQYALPARGPAGPPGTEATPLSAITAPTSPSAIAAASLDQLGEQRDAMGGPMQVPGAPTGAPNAGPSPRHAAYQAALVSPVVIEDRASLPPPAHGSEAAAPDASVTSSSPLPVSVGAPFAGHPQTAPVDGGGGTPPLANPQAPSDAPHRGPAVIEPTSLSARLEPAGAPLTLRAGTLIPGLLLTGVNSDLPGQVLAQTSRDVFDSRTERHLLIPKGSRLVGVYDSRTVGSGRLVVTWTRLILPDGRSLRLPGLPAQDETGQTGVHDQVNHHYGRIYGTALLLSVLSAGLQLSQPQQASAFAAPSTRQVAAGAVGQELTDVSTQTIRRGLDIPPTITIRPGLGFNVFLTGDIAFEAPYTPTP